MGQSKLNKRMGGDRSQKGLKHLAKKKYYLQMLPSSTKHQGRK